MYRFVALLFALLMPLQTTWAVAAAYCQHEARLEASHLGHHEHVHKADADAAGTNEAGVKEAANTALAGDNDCGACHATGSAIASQPVGHLEAGVMAVRVVFPPASLPASALVRAPDRPQWRRLA